MFGGGLGRWASHGKFSLFVRIFVQKFSTNTYQPHRPLASIRYFFESPSLPTISISASFQRSCAIVLCIIENRLFKAFCNLLMDFDEWNDGELLLSPPLMVVILFAPTEGMRASDDERTELEGGR